MHIYYDSAKLQNKPKGKIVMKYFKLFFKDENGAELIQFALVIAIVAVLAIAIQGVVSSSKNKVNEAKDLIDGIDIGGNGNSGGNGEITP